MVINIRGNQEDKVVIVVFLGKHKWFVSWMKEAPLRVFVSFKREKSHIYSEEDFGVLKEAIEHLGYSFTAESLTIPTKGKVSQRIEFKTNKDSIELNDLFEVVKTLISVV